MNTPPKPSTPKRARTAGRRRPGDPSGLTREDVVSAALKLVDTRGLAALSLRDLARELGVYPTAVTWHVGNKANLHGEIVTLALAGITPPRPPRSKSAWQGWIRNLMQGYRSALHRHPNVAPLLTAQLASNAGISTELTEATLGVLHTAGFTGKNLINAYNAIVGTMMGWVSLELAPASSDDTAGRLERQIRELPADEYPVIAAHRDLLANNVFVLRWQNGVTNPLDASFKATVDALLAGLAAKLRH